MAERAPHTLAVAYPTALARPLTGHVELALGQVSSARMLRPDRVSAVLEAVFERIGGADVTVGLLERLTSGARAWLLAKAAHLFLPGTRWFQASCTSCGEAYDLSLSLANLPRAPKTDAFPVVEVETSLGSRRFEVPNGRVERALAACEPDDALRVLAHETSLDGAVVAEFSHADLEAIEAALDAASPDIADEIVTICPTCEAETTTRFDPLEFAFPKPGRLFQDIHVLAQAYGWREAEILDLPSDRRRLYADLIRRERRR